MFLPSRNLFTKVFSCERKCEKCPALIFSMLKSYGRGPLSSETKLRPTGDTCSPSLEIITDIDTRKMCHVDVFSHVQVLEEIPNLWANG